MRLKLFDVALAALGRGVPAVHKAVDVDVVQPAALRHLDQREQVGDVAVHAAVGDKPHHMQLFAVPLGVVHRLDERGIGEKVAVLDRLGDAGEFLIDDPAGTDIEVTDLAVAHLSFGKTDRKPARLEPSGGIFVLHRDHSRRSLGRDRVVGTVRSDAVAVHNDKSCEFHKNLFGFRLKISPLRLFRLYFSTTQKYSQSHCPAQNSGRKTRI